mgnify:CR=1 FL=1
MSNTKITVVIPSLNVAPYIRQCMDSVLDQTLDNIEVFVVDANSTDGTHEILAEYAAKDSRVMLFDDIKKSTGYAKNVGIEQGHGKYYAVVEADDYIEPTMFEDMVKIAEETGAEIVKGNYNNFICENNVQRNFYGTISPFPEDYNKITNPKKDNHSFIWGMFEWLGIYRMDFLREHKIRHNETKGAAYQDTGFWFLTFAYANKIYLTDKAYYNYRRDNPFSSMKNTGNVFGICNEYEYIAGCLDEDKETTERTKPAWYRGFFYDNCIACNRLNDEGRVQLAGRMHEVMLQGKSERMLHRTLYSDEEWENLERLLTSPDEFLNKRFIGEQEIKRNREKLICEIAGNSELIIFGAGWYGLNLQYVLEHLGVTITALADNDEAKWGKVLNNTRILSLDECMKLYPNALYFVANKYHSDEIVTGLLDAGVEEKKIKTWRLEQLTDTVV